MKVRIVIEPDTNSKHGMRKGRVFEVIARHKPVVKHLAEGYWVMGDAGKRVLLLSYEVAIVDEVNA